MTPEQVKNNFPNVTKRMVEFGQHAVTSWKEKITRIPGATGRPLAMGPPMVQLNRTTYEASILMAPTEWEPSAVSVTIYSESPQAEPIEEGSPEPELDLHRMLPHAPKARMSKAGNLYLRIPFRHATQSAEGGPVLPPGILAAMQPKPRYLINRVYQEPQVTAWIPPVRRGIHSPFVTAPRGVTRFGYTALTEMGIVRPKSEARLTLAEAYAVLSRRTKKYLLPPEQRVQQAKRLEALLHVGRQGHGHYLTIRTLSEANPEGWRIPGYKAQHLRQAVAQDLRAIMQDFFDEAMKADMQVWLANAGVAA